MSRRSALKRTAATAFLLSQAALLEQLASPLVRPASAATTFSDIQFDLGAFVRPAQVFNDGAGNVTAQFGITYALFLPARLTRTPTRADQATLANALNTIEASYPGQPVRPAHRSGFLRRAVFQPAPAGRGERQHAADGALPDRHGDTPGRPVLVEATPMPTDVVGGFVGGPNALIPGVTKDRFNINVVIENNDVLFMFRSDSTVNLAAVPLWLMGSNNLNGRGVPSPNFNGLFNFQPTRLQFVQQGLPRKMADQYGFDFAPRVNPNSSMAMGFVDQQVNAAGPPAICTFVGNSSAKLTNAQLGSYFDNGSIAHFSHDIEDLFQFYAQPNQDPRHPDGETFQERCQYAFNSNQLGTTNGIPAAGNTDQFTNGGGPAFIPNVFQGTDAAMRSARTAPASSAPATRPWMPRSPAWAASATTRACSGHHAHQMARRCTSGTTDPGSTAWTCPRSAPTRLTSASTTRQAAPCSSCSSSCSYRPLTCSPRCEPAWRRRTCSSSSTSTPMTTDSSGSSPPPAGRTSSSRPAATAPSP